MPRKKKKDSIFARLTERETDIFLSFISLFFAVIFTLSIFNSAGFIGTFIREIFFYNGNQIPFLGTSFIPLTLFLFLFSYLIFQKEKLINLNRVVASFILFMFAYMLFVAKSFSDVSAGIVAIKLNALVVSLFGEIFSIILIFVLFGTSLYLTNRFSPVSIWNWLLEKRDDYSGDEDVSEYSEDEEYEDYDVLGEVEEDYEEEEEEYSEDEEYEDDEIYDNEEELEESSPVVSNLKGGGGRDDDTDISDKSGVKQAKLKKEYQFPPYELLRSGRGSGKSSNTKQLSDSIKRTLANFKIRVEVEEVVIGPTFTRFSLRPAEGVRLQKLVSLQQNLELALAAHPIRIEAPIPGKSLVGIEVPNSTRATVGLRALIDNKKFEETKGELPIAIGKTINGELFSKSLAKMPHCLVAGTTGSGKSVLIHNFILSMLFTYSPTSLRFIFIDPKRVELTLYKGIPHMYTDPITSPKEALKSLAWAGEEMERRYELLESMGARDIDGYNKKLKETDDRYMPYLVIVVDELADLMQNFPREIEGSIVRLAQKSRAVGIHLLLSTQRPSVNVITGVVKANIPVRIALQVASNVDSRTILDQTGAENLTGNGDLLFASSETKNPVRIQSAFVDETEVKEVVKFITNKNNVVAPFVNLESKNNSSSVVGDEGDDDLYEDAKAIVIQSKRASTSLLQRKLKVGYSRAARLIDMLEENGVVGPAAGSKGRDVLIEE